MVLPLGPGKFYGSSLPRPRFYTDIKFSDERVDPPVPVLDPLLSWANEAHWSMGGLSRSRLRLQGKIEGNVEKLRKEKEKVFKNKPQISTPILKSKRKISRKIVDSPTPPPVSRKLKLRSRVVALVGGKDDDDDDDEEDEEAVVGRKRRRLFRKLGDDFEMVANENGKNKRRSPLKDVSNGRLSRRVMVLMEEEESDNDGGSVGKINKGGAENVEKGYVSKNGARSSPRLKKKSS